MWLVGKQIQAVEIRLNPAELGPLKVQISIDDNSANISFSATHAVTREVLENALPRLKDMLAENGVSLGDVKVSDQGIADRRNDSNRSRPTEVAPVDENSSHVVSDLLPNRVPQRDPSALVDTYV